MSEENGTVTEPLDTTTADEATAAAAAFDNARSDTPVVVEPSTPEPIVEAPPAPRLFAGKTEEELTALLSDIPSMRDGYRKQIDNLAGNVGSLKSALQRLQQDTPKGEAVTVNDDDLADMRREFPELADMTKAALNNVLKRASLKGSAAIDPAMIDERVNTLVTERVSSERVAIHKELLDGFAPDWETVVGIPDADGVAPKTEYRAWLATQPADYQTKIGNSNNAFEISASVKSFQSAREEQAKKQSQNKQRLTNVIQPTGSTAARSAISEQQAAEDAFKRSRGR